MNRMSQALGLLLFSPKAVPYFLKPDESAKLFTASLYTSFITGFMCGMAVLTVLQIGLFSGLLINLLFGFIYALFFMLRLILKSGITSFFIKRTRTEALTGTDIYILYSSSFYPLFTLPFFIIFVNLISLNWLIIFLFIILWSFSLRARFVYYNNIRGYFRIKPGLLVLLPVIVEFVFFLLMSLITFLIAVLMLGYSVNFVMEYLENIFPVKDSFF